MFVSAAKRVRSVSALRLAKGAVPLPRPVYPCEEKRLVTASTCCVAVGEKPRKSGLGKENLGKPQFAYPPCFVI